MVLPLPKVAETVRREQRAIRYVIARLAGFQRTLGYPVMVLLNQQFHFFTITNHSDFTAVSIGKGARRICAQVGKWR